MKSEPDARSDVPIAAERSMLEELIDAPAEGGAALARVAESLVGEIIDTEHPTLLGRVLVTWSDLDGRRLERWLPSHRGLSLRVADRVTFHQPANWPEPVVTGVIDGFAKRSDPARSVAASLTLKPDETFVIRTVDEKPAFELYQSEAGPVVRLLQPGLNVELPGVLRISAEQIELHARQGDLKLKATDDVIVEGETINLN